MREGGSRKMNMWWSSWLHFQTTYVMRQVLGEERAVFSSVLRAVRRFQA